MTDCPKHVAVKLIFQSDDGQQWCVLHWDGTSQKSPGWTEAMMDDAMAACAQVSVDKIRAFREGRTDYPIESSAAAWFRVSPLVEVTLRTIGDLH